MENGTKLIFSEKRNPLALLYFYKYWLLMQTLEYSIEKMVMYLKIILHYYYNIVTDQRLIYKIINLKPQHSRCFIRQTDLFLFGL